ncbi:MAG: hypothetical protein ACRD1H_18275 [Vicinamibacterales bacterium]
MTEPQPPSVSPSSPPPAPGLIVVTPGEFYWLTLGVWLGGIFILALMPVLLIPRIGMPFGVAGSYLLFFVAWQPIQIITQRAFGMRLGVIRMIVFVAAAATIAYYLREVLLGMSRA